MVTMATATSNGLLRVTSERTGEASGLRASLVEACSSAYGADCARLMYGMFDAANAYLFAGQLPCPHISWGLHPYGHAVGSARHAAVPAVMFQPRIYGQWAYVLDVLVHELTHVAVNLGDGRGKGSSSHNCEGWVREVNRLAPLLGFENVRASVTKSTRVAVPGGALSARGKLPTRVVKQTDGSVPLAVLSRFPGSMRDASYLAASSLPTWVGDDVRELASAMRRGNT
jgi:hypothetical protein